MPDYFVTWTKQRDLISLPVVGAADDEFHLADGSRVYDFVSTSFQSHFGHSNQRIISAIVNQLQTLPIASPKASFSLKHEVSIRLLKLLGLPEGKIFYTVSGAESVENAIKIARRVTRRPIILARKKSYHGASLGAMSVSGDWRRDDHLAFDEGTVRIPEPDQDPTCELTRDVIRQTGPEKIAAVIVEPISGTNGVCIPEQSWFNGLRSACDEFGILLIIDEVLCGFGRCGTPFAFQHYRVKPDLVCMSKGITGGYVPFGAVWLSQQISDFYNNNVLTCGLTNYAHPLGLAAMGAVLDVLADDGFKRDCQALCDQFSQSLTEMGKQFGASALRVRGLLAAVEFGDRKLPAWDVWVKNGLYVFSKGNMLVLAPPLVSQPERLVDAFSQAATVLNSL